MCRLPLILERMLYDSGGLWKTTRTHEKRKSQLCLVLVSCLLKPFNFILFFLFLPWSGLGKMYSVDGDVGAFGRESL